MVDGRGYMTVSSCEGHADEKSRLELSFLQAMMKPFVSITPFVRSGELLCHWELTARFIRPDVTWVLGWKLENWGVKCCAVLSNKGLPLPALQTTSSCELAAACARLSAKAMRYTRSRGIWRTGCSANLTHRRGGAVMKFDLGADA